jgi:short-subunit dehydrogenase
MENSFGQPQSVVVLGGSSDIARALTKRLCAARAHTVVLCGRNQKLLDEAAEESSVAAIRIRRNAYLYGGAKAGLDRLCDGLADSLDGTGVTLQLLRSGVVRTRMTKGQAPVPFTTGPEEVAGYVMKGLATNDRVIWSPPIMRFAFAMLRHLPKPLWRKVADH